MADGRLAQNAVGEIVVQMRKSYVSSRNNKRTEILGEMAAFSDAAHQVRVTHLPRREQHSAEQKFRRTPRLGSRLRSKAYFLERLRCEQLRASRAETHLSIVVFVTGSLRRNAHRDFRELLATIEQTTRETDVLGCLGEHVIGVLLPDTDSKGTQKFVEKFRRKISDVGCSVTTGTYPDQVFETLQSEGKVLPDPFPLLLDHFEPLTKVDRILKRTLDIAGALVALLLLSPLMLITAFAIQLTSPGPVIFKQIRLGKRCTPFVFYKFRSMRCDADDRIHREYIGNLIDGNPSLVNQGDTERPLFKIKSDPRVTAVGKIIRRTSIDELPQLLNVLKGDMSLVGPRPPIPYETEKYEAWHLMRLMEVKPGITGLWQVSGRSNIGFADMVRLDLHYTRTYSLMLDLGILIKTVKVVLRCKGSV